MLRALAIALISGVGVTLAQVPPPVLSTSHALPPTVQAHEVVSFERHPAFRFGNNRLELTITEQGASLVSLTLRDAPGTPNPLWNPVRMRRELGRTDGAANTAFGHFLCLDGFGPPSAAEQKAGIPFHGEASQVPWQLLPSGRLADVTSLRLQTRLPRAQQSIIRSVSLVDGEYVAYFRNSLTSEVAFDRPVSWAEHTTIGAPFLASGITMSSVSGTRAQTKPYQGTTVGTLQRRLMSGQDFTWPFSPGRDGRPVDLTMPPPSPNFVDHATVLVDPALTLGWVASVNPEQRLVLGYMFKRTDFPWIMSWGSYPAAGDLARGLEFSTQPYDVSHQQAVALNGMFGAPTFRWLPALTTIEANFIMFLAPVPSGFGKVARVALEAGEVVVEDVSGVRIALRASQQW